MARCGCGGAAGTPCNCAIIAGDGITVTGDGTGGNAYTISLAPGGQVTIAGEDSDTIDLTVTSAGTTHTIRGDAVVSPDPGNALSARSNGLYVASGDGGPTPVYPAALVTQTASQSIPDTTWTRVQFHEVTGSPPGITLTEDGEVLQFEPGHWFVSAFLRFSGTFAASNLILAWAMPGDSAVRLSGSDARAADPAMPNPGLHLATLLTPEAGLTELSLWVYQNSGQARTTQVSQSATHVTAKKLPS